MTLKLAANLTLLYPELPFLDRFAAAAEAGFDAVEILFPYDHPAPEIIQRLSALELPLVLINAPPPNYTGGARGFAAVPGSKARFQSDFRRTMRYAKALRPGLVHVMAGAAEGPEAKATFIENLRWAAAEAPEQRLTIEPLNTVDMPGYFLDDYDLALEVIDAVGASNLGLQYDTYHAQMITGDALAAWDRYGARAAHVQLGDAPGRVEPGSGRIDFPAVFARLRASGYAGYVSAEYKPSRPTPETLGWMKEARGT